MLAILTSVSMDGCVMSFSYCAYAPRDIFSWSAISCCVSFAFVRSSFSLFANVLIVSPLKSLYCILGRISKKKREKERF